MGSERARDGQRQGGRNGAAAAAPARPPPSNDVLAPARPASFDFGAIPVAADGDAPARRLNADDVLARLEGTAPAAAGTNATDGVPARTASTLARVEARAASAPAVAEVAPTAPEQTTSPARLGPQRTELSPAADGAAPGAADVTATPGAQTPSATFEASLSAQIAEYLNGNVSPERQERLGATTTQLLQAAETLGQRRITDPDLAGLRGLERAAQPGAPANVPPEPLWVRTVSVIRDITGQLGGIVGIIGLAATVGGFILSLLIPPVGAFLLTVGRF